jgi:hypothetical protein
LKIQVRGNHIPDVQSNEPLYKRVPAYSDDGKPLSDFMMLIPGLREWSVDRFTDRLAGMQAVLGQYQQVVFADLNVPLNILWVSMLPEFGLITRISADLQSRVPEAKLIASDQS